MPDSENPRTPTPIANPELEYIVQTILPVHEVHLIGGPSGAGKTTLLFQLIEDWRNGRQVLGYDSYPAPFIYVSCDRSRAATNRTLSRLDLKQDFPILSLAEHTSVVDAETLIATATKQVQNLRVIFLDAIAVLTPSGKINDYNVVARFLTKLTRLCKKFDLTIVALGHTTKVKGEDKFHDPRQRFLGSVAWGGYSDTMLHIEPANPEDPTDPTRTITLLPRNSAIEVFPYTFDSHGKLVPAGTEDDFVLDSWLDAQADNVEFSTSTLWEICQANSISRPTMYRWLKQAKSDGKILKTKHGSYQKRARN